MDADDISSLTCDAKNPSKWSRRLVMLGICGVGLSLGATWFVGGKLCQGVNRHVGASPRELPFENVQFQSESGTSVFGWYGEQESSHATILLVHPLRGDRRTMLSRARLLWDQGYSVLLFDLQAHGETAGKNITFGYLEKNDVAAAVAYARSRNPQHDIGLIGWSLGGAAAVLAASPDVDAMVLEAVYPTINQAVDNRLKIRLGSIGTLLSPVLLGQLQPRLGIRTSDLRPVDLIDQINCPLLVMAGANDQHTTLDESKELYRRAARPKSLVIFDDAEHVDFFAFDRERYSQELLSFFAEHMTSPTTASP